MSETTKRVLDEALELPASERALIAEQILLSLDRPEAEIDAAWAAEAEARLDAYQKGKLEAVPVSDVLGKYADE